MLPFVIRKKSLDYFLDLSSKLDETSVKFYGVTVAKKILIFENVNLSLHDMKSSYFFSRL